MFVNRQRQDALNSFSEQLLRLRDGKVRGLKPNGALVTLGRELIAAAKEEVGYPDSDDSDNSGEDSDDENDNDIATTNANTNANANLTSTSVSTSNSNSNIIKKKPSSLSTNAKEDLIKKRQDVIAEAIRRKGKLDVFIK